MKSNITAHMVVKNEDRFVWYAIFSVLPYVEKFIIYDTGSTDQTGVIIRLFDNPRIVFEQKGKSDQKRLVTLRQEQIDRTKTDWIWIVDGDEIYPQKTVKEILGVVNSRRAPIGIIVHRYDLLGDIYHYQDETVGSYNQFGKKGHYVLRLINKNRIPDLHVYGEYPNEYWVDKNKISIKARGQNYFSFVENRIFHAMYLSRSTHGGNLKSVLNRSKIKTELGKNIPTEDIPEVFFQPRPNMVSEVTAKSSPSYMIPALLITPFKKLKRKLF